MHWPCCASFKPSSSTAVDDLVWSTWCEWKNEILIVVILVKLPSPTNARKWTHGSSVACKDSCLPWEAWLTANLIMKTCRQLVVSVVDIRELLCLCLIKLCLASSGVTVVQSSLTGSAHQLFPSTVWKLLKGVSHLYWHTSPSLPSFTYVSSFPKPMSD